MQRPTGDGPSLGRQRQPSNGSSFGAGTSEAGEGVFGVGLEELLARDREARPWLQVPLFVKKALTYLTAYGLAPPLLLPCCCHRPALHTYE
jgi:hypothetical protein